MTFISVKHFEKHQHYKNRRPPWIKLYNDLLDNYDFLALPEVSQRHLVMIWLIASRHDNRIPDDLTYIARAIHARGRLDLTPLFDAGFLTREAADGETLLADCQQTASGPQAKSPQNATPERETEAEGEKRKKKKQSPRQRAARARSTWLKDFADCWLTRYGGEMPIEQALRPIGQLISTNDRSEVLRRWRIYLEATDGAYANAHRFASTFGQWEKPPPLNGNGAHRIGGVTNRSFANATQALENEP